MRWHRFGYVVFLIAAFALSMLVVDRVLAPIPALCGEITITSVTVTDVAHAGDAPGGAAAYAQSSVSDNSTMDYGVLEQYDWIIVFGGLTLTLLLAFCGASAYTIACRARIDACRADIDAAERMRARLLAEANRLTAIELDHTSGVLKQVLGGIFSTQDLYGVIERNPALSNDGTRRLLRQTERCEKRLIRDQKRRNAFISEYNATIHSFPLCLFAKRLGFTDQTGYDIARDSQDIIADAALEL